MRTRNRFIVSAFLLAVSIALFVCGVVLFKMLPNVPTDLMTNKDILISVLSVLMFIFAFSGLFGSIGMFIYGLVEFW